MKLFIASYQQRSTMQVPPSDIATLYGTQQKGQLIPQDQAAELINTFFANIGPSLANNFGEVRDMDFITDPSSIRYA